MLEFCVSYATAWKYLRQLTSEAMYLDHIREGHWMWAYDNLNIYQRVRHERYGKYLANKQTNKQTHHLHNIALEHHSMMTNLTSRLAIKICYLPNYDFNWSDTTPQMTRSSLTIDHFLPSESDSSILKERAVHYMMNFLVESFPCLSDLKKFVPTPEPIHKVVPSEVMPMKILFKDEKFKSETIEILTQLLIDAGLSGDQQV